MSGLVLRCWLPSLRVSRDRRARATAIYHRLEPASLILFGVQECPDGLRPYSSLRFSYDFVSTTPGPWPLRHVSLCDCFGPRRRRACVPAFGLAASISASHSIKWRRGSELHLEAVSSDGGYRAQPRSHQSWSTGSHRLGQAMSPVGGRPGCRRSDVYNHETLNLAIKVENT